MKAVHNGKHNYCEGDIYFPARMKIAVKAVLSAAVAVFCVYAAVVSKGQQSFFLNPDRSRQIINSPVGFGFAFLLFQGVAVALGIFACYFARRLLSGGPIMRVNECGVWHNALPGGPYSYRWEQLERVRITKKTHHDHLVSFHIKFILRKKKRWFFSQIGSGFDMVDAAGSKTDILNSFRKYASDTSVDFRQYS